MRYGYFTRLFFTSLLNLLVIIAGLSVFLRLFLMNTIYEEIRKQDEEILFQIQRRMDSDIVAMRRMALSISLNSRFTPFDLPDNPDKAIQAIRDLKTHVLISENISLLGIVYAKSEYALANTGSITRNFFSVFSLPSYEELSKRENLEKGFIIIDDFIVFIFPYPSWQNTSVHGVLFVQYQRNLFYDEFIRTLSENRRFLSISNANSDTGSAALFSNNTLTSEETIRNVYVSPETGYSYEIVTPLSYYRAILNRFQLTLVLAISGLFGLAFLMNLLIARYNVLPLKKLVGKFGLPDSPVDFKSIETILYDRVDTEQLDALLRSFAQTLRDKRWADNAAAAESVFGFSRRYSLSTARYIFWRVLFLLSEQNLIPPVPAYQLMGRNTIDELIQFVKTLLDTAVNTIEKLARSTGAELDRINEIKTYIEQHFEDKNISLESLADSFGLSVGYLSRLFKQNIGTTAASYIQNLRVQEACRLLQFTEMPVKDIVSKIGYMDHSSFSRSFKGQMGISPQEYRNRNQQQEKEQL
jgi:AraC-like DNA-binding protein